MRRPTSADRGVTGRIRDFDRSIEELVADAYPEAQHLQQPKGVGSLTALAFVLLIEDPRRFSRSGMWEPTSDSFPDWTNAAARVRSFASQKRAMNWRAGCW
jgi:hypothetical protein